MGDINPIELIHLLNRYQLSTEIVDPETPIPGSFWGDEEAGLIRNRLYLRSDTPVHSALHESCHYICMDGQRRQLLDTNAGGDCDEESAVCYLQILLSEELPSMGRMRMFEDMDSWGYSFRLGSVKAWFESDAEDAKSWLLGHQLINPESKPTFQCRGC